MENAQSHLRQFKVLISEYTTVKAEITADGTVDDGESLNLREFLGGFEVRMSQLKAALTDDIHGLREKYRARTEEVRTQISGQAGAREVLKLRAEFRTAFELYERLIEQVDYWLTLIPEERQHVLDLIATREAEMNNVFNRFAPVTFDERVLDESPARAELTRARNAWQNLVKNIEHKASDAPQQAAYDKGVQRALELAIADVSRVLSMMD